MKVGSLVRYIRDPEMFGIIQEREKFQFITRNFIIWNDGYPRIAARLWFDDSELELLSEGQ